MRTRVRSPNYPWAEWFPRRRFVLRRGEDYHCGQINMAQQIRNAAVRHGYLVELDDLDDAIGVVATPKDGNGAK